MKYKILLTFIIFLVISCNREDGNIEQFIAFKKNRIDSSNSGCYPDYEFLQYPHVKNTFEKKGVYEVKIDSLNIGNRVSEILQNYKISYSLINSNLLEYEENISGCIFNFYLDSLHILNLLFSLNSQVFINIDSFKNKEIWDYVLKQKDFRILTRKIFVQKYIDSEKNFDTIYLGDKSIYYRFIKPLDSINIIRYGRKFIKF